MRALDKAAAGRIKAALSTRYEDVATALSTLTGGRPALAALLTALGTGALGAIGTPLLAKLLVRARMPQLSELASQALMQQDLTRMRFRGGLMGGLLGLALWSPMLYKRIAEQGLLGPFKKSGGLVLYEPAARTIQEDPYLSPIQKMELETLLGQAADYSAFKTGKFTGLLTTEDLLAGAVGAGLGYAGARIAAPALGAALGLPAPALKRFSRLGGLAGFLLSSGVIH